MIEIVIMDGYYFPPFFTITLWSLALWLGCRNFYKDKLYSSSVIHPALCDISLMFIAFGVVLDIYSRVYF